MAQVRHLRSYVYIGQVSQVSQPRKSLIYMAFFSATPNKRKCRILKVSQTRQPLSQLRFKLRHQEKVRHLGSVAGVAVSHIMLNRNGIFMAPLTHWPACHLAQSKPLQPRLAPRHCPKDVSDPPYGFGCWSLARSPLPKNCPTSWQAH